MGKDSKVNTGSFAQISVKSDIAHAEGKMFFLHYFRGRTNFNILILFILFTATVIAILTLRTNNKFQDVFVDDFHQLRHYGEKILECELNINIKKDPQYEYIRAVARLMDITCHKHGVIWFVWGKAALSLLAYGALYGKHDDVLLSPSYPQFDIFVTSDKIRNIYNLWKDLALSINHMEPTLRCDVNNPEGVTGGCSVITSSKSTMRVSINGHALINANRNELHMINSQLHQKYVYFKLNRILPVAFASYYGFALPVPKDPVYALSHVMSYKGSLSSTKFRYEFGQGCISLTKHAKELRHNVPTQGNLRADTSELETCGVLIHSNGFQSLYGLCNKDRPEEVFVPLDVLLSSAVSVPVLYLEDFYDNVILQKGNGTYNLTQKNGRFPDKLSWSQYGQDLFVDNIFNKTRNGFFIEVGGYDGESLSNTLLLERERGWSGLLIEAIPYLYTTLVNKQRRCFSTNACISNTDERLTFTVAEALSSSDIHMTNAHRVRINNALPKAKWQHKGERLTVNCKSLMTILNKIGRRHVDYFSLDVEGSELLILNSIDWDKLDVELFTIETDHHRNEIIAFMESHGYERIAKLTGDDVFKKRHRPGVGKK